MGNMISSYNEMCRELLMSLLAINKTFIDDYNKLIKAEDTIRRFINAKDYFSDNTSLLGEYKKLIEHIQIINVALDDCIKESEKLNNSVLAEVRGIYNPEYNGRFIDLCEKITTEILQNEENQQGL